MTNFVKEEKFENIFKKNINDLRSSGTEFAKENPSLGKFLNLYHSKTYDPETERLIESFAYMISQLDLKIENFSDTSNKNILISRYQEIINKIPLYSMVKIEIIDVLFDRAERKHITENDIFSTKTEIGQNLFFKSMTNRKLTSHKVRENLFIKKNDENPYLYSSHYKISIDLSTSTDRNFIFYINAELKNSLNVMDDILNKNNNAYLVFNNKKILVNKKNIGCYFEFNHYLRKKIKNNIYNIFDFFNYINRYMFFYIDLSDYEIEGTKLDILIEAKNENAGLFFKKDFFCLNVIPLINIFYRKNEAFKIKDENHHFHIENDTEKNEEVMTIDSVELYNTKEQTTQKVLAASEFYSTNVDLGVSTNYTYVEKGYSFDRTKLHFDILKLNENQSFSEEELYVVPHLIYSNGSFADFILKDSIFNAHNLNFIKACNPIFIGQSQPSLYDSTPVFRNEEVLKFLEETNHNIKFCEINSLRFFVQLVDLICIDEINKKSIKNIFNSLNFEERKGDKSSRCISQKITIKEKNHSYNGAIFFLEFIKQYFDLVKVTNFDLNYVVSYE